MFHRLQDFCPKQNKIGEVTIYGRTYACVSFCMEAQIQFKGPQSATTQL